MKQQGGEILHNLNEVEVSCLPQDLPEFIEVDMANVEVGQVLHMTDIKLPKALSWFPRPTAATCRLPTFTLRA